jgi:biopolymer transport protein ExbB
MKAVQFRYARGLVIAAILLAAVTPGLLRAQDGGQNGEQTTPQEAADALAAETDSALIRAYQREFVFLNNEIDILEERLDEVEDQGEARVNAAQNRLQELEAELLQLTAQVDRRSEELRIIEEEEFEAQDADDALRNIIQQANERLTSNDMLTFAESDQAPADGEMTEGERLAAELDYIFEVSFEVLLERGELRVVEQPFFLESGEQVDGRVVLVGEIAALGVSAEAGGTLAPAGGGRLRLIDASTEDVARSLVEQSGAVSALPVYTYESLDEAVEGAEEGSFIETVEDSGIIGIVILAIGAVAFVLIIIRAVLLANVGTGDKNIVEEAISALKEKDFDRALAAVRKQKGAIGRVLTSTVQGLRHDPENIEDVISESVLNEQPAIDRFRSTISVFAAVAPLLGLLGTVTGMIATFDVITQFGTGDPRLLSGGISEALITTMFGLSVAIPTLLIGNLLSSWADRITSTMEVTALRLVNVVGGYDRSDVA